MIKSITVTNHLKHSIVLSLSDPWSTGLIIQSITGLGPPKAAINSTDLAMGDGAAFNSSRIDKRNIVFNFKLSEILAADGQHIKQTIEQVRLDTYKYFPLKKKVTLDFITDTRSASIEGYVESNEPDIFNKEESAQISIVCPDPFFYRKLDPISLNGVDPAFEFPFSNPVGESWLMFGNTVFEQGRNIRYDGDAECGITMTMHAIGPVHPIIISNNNSEETMTIDTSKLATITGSSTNHLQPGDDLIISSVASNIYCRLIRNGVTYNALSCIPKLSDWLHLYRGDNFFTYHAEDDTGVNLLLDIDGYALYTGV